MKRTIRKRRRDGVVQRYHIGSNKMAKKKWWDYTNPKNRTKVLSGAKVSDEELNQVEIIAGKGSLLATRMVPKSKKRRSRMVRKKQTELQEDVEKALAALNAKRTEEPPAQDDSSITVEINPNKTITGRKREEVDELLRRNNPGDFVRLPDGQLIPASSSYAQLIMREAQKGSWKGGADATLHQGDPDMKKAELTRGYEYKKGISGSKPSGRKVPGVPRR